MLELMSVKTVCCILPNSQSLVGIISVNASLKLSSTVLEKGRGFIKFLILHLEFVSQTGYQINVVLSGKSD